MSQELQAREKTPVDSQGEHTKEGPVFAPRVDIFEAEDSLTLVADMPGVTKEGLSIGLNENVLSITGEVKPAPDGRTVVYREYWTGDYARQFTLSNVIDQSRISASLKDGVLTLILPKVEKAKPRQIEVSVA